MSKRRRTSSVASRGQDDDPESSDTPTPEPSRKRKKQDPTEICHQLYDVIRNHKKDDGTLLCDSFIRVRKRRQEPEYYEVVSNPIDLMKIQQKLKTDEYDDVEELTSDVQLMVNNAKIFYKRTSTEHRDACDLWDLFLSNKSRLLDAMDEEPKGKIILKVGKLARRAAAAEARRQDAEMAEDTSESSTNADDDLSNQFEDLFTAVMLATDLDNRPLHTVFQLLPSKKLYPEYYEVIDNPIDLKQVATKIQENKYLSLNDMEKDLLQMTRNACLFNEPGSQIYKDAKSLKKIITGKKIEVEHGKFTPGKSSERIRNKRLRGGQTLSAITAALQDEEEDSDEGENVEEEEEELEDADSPRWQLYELIKNATNNQGNDSYQLSEPFWKLPSRKNYPDYYKEIRNPLSLFQIRNKLRRGDYGTVSEVAGDLNIMFENAKKYNRQDSRLYKDAVKLQKIMQAKVQELLDFEQESDSDDDDDDRSARRRRSGHSAAGKIMSPLKKRLHMICKSLLEFTREDGRQPILMFMEKPSKKLYPDYFQVIAEPIDVLTIESNIKSDKYSTEEEMLADFKLMFDNCRQYNEEGSMIYDDASTLEEYLKARVAGLTDSSKKKVVKRPIIKEVYRNSSPKPKKSPVITILSQKLKTLYDTIRDHKDSKGRQLSLIFLKLPSKSEYPDYYEVIKRPIDLERISQKLKANQYETLEDMVSDIVLMFDNACKYNEPDSQIYKDALMLQRVALQTKLQMRENDESVPDVTSAVQELITSLFISVYNHQDEEGRCFSDSMAELPEHDDNQGIKVRALSLDLIKRRLDRNLYRRLDAFQDDMFACFERARRLSRTDSQVFEDSIELQSYFIRQRDELCRSGDLLHSPALSFMLLHLSHSVESTRQSKLTGEQPEEDAETRSSEDSMPIKQETSSAVGNSLSYNQQVYRVGDFVYIVPKERGMEPRIVMVERLWTNNEGQQMMYGNYFYRPNETYHVTTRKFLEKEVFKSDQHTATPLDTVQGICCVLFVKDYFRFRHADIVEKDVYVCESRYSTKARAFKKIKVWPCAEREQNLVPREEPLELRRVMSVFRERVEKHKEEIAELEEREKIIDKEKPNVEVLNPHGMEGCTYYEQYVIVNVGPIRTSDCVFVRTDSGRQLIAQVDSIWTNKQGVCYFQGPWLVTPPEIPHAPTRLFYKQEVFLSTLDDTNTISSIVGKCAVLEHGEYISCRPTEIPESDVFVCEAIYDEARRQVRPLPPEGLKKYTHSHAVFEDEIYFFRRLINPPKIGSESAQLQTDSASMAPPHYDLLQEAVAMIPRGIIDESDIMTEDSMDGGPPSVGSGDILPPAAISTPVTTKKVLGLMKKNKKDGKKVVTGYILYSSDVRRNVASNHPLSNFGEISRIVGNEWRNLPAQEKQMWEEKAAKCNEETTAKFAEGGRDLCSSPAVLASPAGTEHSANSKVFECLWDNCDWQFDEITDCLDHCIQEPKGHVHLHFAQIPPQDAEYQCQWRGCGRLKKNVPPFPNVQRLARHVKEVHIQKSSGRIILPCDRSKNFVPSRKSIVPAKNLSITNPHLAVGNSMSRQTPSPLAHAAGASANVRHAEPLFVSVPPRPQRLLHSDAYIKYIEGLHVDNKYISSWDKQLRANSENTPVPDASRLPEHWLSNGVGNHGTIVNALWTLRDFMMRDAFGINKVIKMNEM